jgi:hypothetical protein
MMRAKHAAPSFPTPLPILTLLLVAVPAMASAQENTCAAFGQGESCRNHGDCADHAAAKVCVRTDGALTGTCEISCRDVEQDRPDPGLCGLGEACTQAEGGLSYCKRTRFRVDLNLLDSCIVHFLEEEPVDLGGRNACSTQESLNRMLDRDQDGMFNIFDVDACIQDFLGREVCAPVPGQLVCDNGDLVCAADPSCGSGAFCDKGTRAGRDAYEAARAAWLVEFWQRPLAEREALRAAGQAEYPPHLPGTLGVCQRECGVVVDRGLAPGELLRRSCAGFGMACDEALGRCIHRDDRGHSCQVDRDCLPGSYCFLGACEPTCFRNSDCPSSDWVCGADNSCRPRPAPAAASAGFNPRDFALHFGQKRVDLDPVEDTASIAVLIMNLRTRRQEVDNPVAVFGYRLELQYGTKEASECNDLRQNEAESPADYQARLKECTISEEEEFLTLLSPFGTLYASGVPAIDVMLDKRAVSALNVGRYPVTLRLIANNGGQTSVEVILNKSTLDGDYSGNLQIYADGPEVPLLRDHLVLGLDIAGDETAVWHDLLTANNLGDAQGPCPEDIADGPGGCPSEEVFLDYNTGLRVEGRIDGDAGLTFNARRAGLGGTPNTIPLQGIYIAERSEMRLVGVVDLPMSDCRGDIGGCRSGDPLNVDNPFARSVRRVFFLWGSFEARSRRFSGIYRETVTGLLPQAITLRGEFHLGQALAEERTLPASTPLLARQSARPLEFPDSVARGTDALLSSAAREVETACAAVLPKWTEIQNVLQSPTEYPRVVSRLWAEGGALAQLVSFESQFEHAIGATRDQGTGTALTIQESLAGKILFCDDGEVNETCIQRPLLQCGLALYRLRMVNGWTVAGDPALGTGDRQFSHQLLCSEFVTSADCADEANDSVLDWRQRYSYLARQLGDTHRFTASAALSDAVFALHRHAGEPLGEGTLAEYKEEQLARAFVSYGEAQALLYRPLDTWVWSEWPMRYFGGRGRSIIRQFSKVAMDRVEALGRLLDTRRRILLETDDGPRQLVHHLMQYEYLGQVALLALQRRWEGAEFAYAGGAQALFDRGGAIVRQVTSGRNPLGLHPNQVYFENSDLQARNWQNYRNQVMAPGVGQLAVVENAILRAQQALRESASAQAQFEGDALMRQQAFESQVNAICGPVLAKDRQAYEVNYHAEATSAALLGGDGAPVQDLCDYAGRRDEDMPERALAWQCAEDECREMVRLVASTEATARDQECRVDTPKEFARLKVGTITRPCVRGQMGQLLRERDQLMLRYRQAYDQLGYSVAALDSSAVQAGRLVADSERIYDLTWGDPLDWENWVQTIANPFSPTEQLQLFGISNIKVAHKNFESVEAVAKDILNESARASNCNIGFSMSCPTAFAGLAVYAATRLIKAVTDRAVDTAVWLAESTYEQELQHIKDREQRESLAQQLAQQVDGFKASMAAIDTLHLQLTHLDMAVLDTWYQAQEAGRMYSESIDSLAENILSGESNAALLQNHFVQEFEREYETLVHMTYKMAMAFVHRYNMASARKVIENRVFQLMSLQDVRDFVRWLDAKERDYCGASGMDCDTENNVATVRFSLREKLFPNLTDIVDAATGKVLTRGEQFHRSVMERSSMFYRRRVRAGRLVDQIELPIDLLLTEVSETESATRWHVSPLECNHLLAGFGQGSIAVNVLGTRLGQLQYELKRGHVDYLRGCEQVAEIPVGGGAPVADWPINAFTVGYAPEHEQGKSDQPLSYVSRTPALLACRNVPDYSKGFVQDESCYRYFARDRSLSTLDTTLVIPISDSSGFGNEWVLGDKLPADEKPIVEDIVLYLRFKSRPIED